MTTGTGRGAPNVKQPPRPSTCEKAGLSLCQWPPLVRAGRASYGIYLVHQNVGVTILSAPVFASGAPALVGPMLVIGAIALIAVWAFEVIESPVQAWLKQRLIGVAPPRSSPADEPSSAFAGIKRVSASPVSSGP